MKIVSFFGWIDICSNFFSNPENQPDIAQKQKVKYEIFNQLL